MFLPGEWDAFIAWLDARCDAEPRQWFLGMYLHDRQRTSYWVMRQLTRWGGSGVARGKGSSVASKQTNSQQWTTFVEISLAGQDMAAVAAYLSDPEDLFDAVQSLVNGGYRLSFSYNEQNDATIVSVTCKKAGHVNEGCTFTSFAGDWVTALRVAMFKHYKISGGKWVNEKGMTERPLFG